jgi:glutamyl-tRNA reductase
MNPQNFFNADLVVIGLSHHTAPVEVREKLAIPEDEWNQASNELCRYDSISEAAVLSTCNRFELYLSGRNQYEAMTDAVNYLLQRTNGTVDEEVLRKSLFMLSGEDAIWHLMRVTAGPSPSSQLFPSSPLFLSHASFPTSVSSRFGFHCDW